jgi:pyruvate,orthophosphate dikinase
MQAAKAVFAETGKSVDYLVGTMIELPRAALRAGEIAEAGEFFSFGTNDLTQTTLGVSRDDAARFLTQYVAKGIYARDPFVSIDVEGVGELVKLAAERGRATRPDIKLGICGEHGGDPASIAFLRKRRAGLCQRLAVPRADCASGGGAGGVEGVEFHPPLSSCEGEDP